VRCQRCPKPATLHISEIFGAKQIEELHFCEECAQKHLYEPAGAVHEKLHEPKPATEAESDDLEELNRVQCPHCGIKFKDFRTTGRLGCPNDYQVFRAHLTPLLENIHGEVQHQGKSPRHRPQHTPSLSVLASLRRQLQAAISREDYEQAATLRDKIRGVEAGEESPEAPTGRMEMTS
jgi:protein arginine kinase activator